ncbi:cell wall anchor protein [Micromonospora sp. SH-82]|uniref:cell wall anchor protein n=1 Tax=Micromonospora sp. SH-82 TaxID=3132938 RepID=UPI003EBDBEF7
MPTSRTRRLGGGLLVATAASLAVLVATPHGAVATSAAARDGATWLADEFTDGTLPGPFGGVDWGLSIDGVLALAATGAAPATRAAATARIAANVRSYNSYDDYGIEGFTDGGATAKLLYLATATGADPRDFGGHDLRAETLSLVAAADTGHQHGRITSRTTEATGPDASNTFDQSFTVLGLTRSGEVAQPTVDFLVRQQCRAGGFRLYPDADGGPSPSCDDQSTPTLDVDSTAMAVQALLAAAEGGATGAAESARRGADWLATQQHTDGSFGGSGPTTGANSNSTGLAGQALAAAGRSSEAARAATALTALQVTAATGGAAAAEAGAIAYNTDAHAAAVGQGIADNDKDQWRRATAQAILGLAQVPLGGIGVDPPQSPEPTPTGGPGEPPPTGQPTPPPTGTATPTTGAPTASPTPGTTPDTTPSTPGPSSTPSPAPTTTTPVAGAPGGALPTTGASIVTWLVVALGSIAGGVALLVFARRRAQ